MTEWIKTWLIDTIIATFISMYDRTNEQIGSIAGNVGKTPEAWNSGIFSMIQTLSETVIIPIAGIILTFILAYELIQMIIEKNNMQDFDTFNIFKWIFKTFIAVLIITNTWNIVMGVFDIAQYVVNQSSDLITGDLTLGSDAMIESLRASLSEMSVGELTGIFLEVQFVKLAMLIMSLLIFIVVWGRMIEIYLTVSVAPIPFATMVNREWGAMGNNYLRALIALAFQGFLIIVCVAIYAVLVAGIVESDNIHLTIWMTVAYTVLLCFTLLKTGGMAKSIFNAH